MFKRFEILLFVLKGFLLNFYEKAIYTRCIFKIKTNLCLSLIILVANFTGSFSQAEVFTRETLGLDKAFVVFDNDIAFSKKVEAIRSTQPGETIRMAYYIWSDDESSSYLSRELLLASQKGVKIKVLLDLLTNTKNYDFYKSLTETSHNQIEFRFFGGVTEKILRDVQFLTWPCPESSPSGPKDCSDFKWKKFTELQKKNQVPPFDVFAKLLLTGLLTKNSKAIETGILVGQEINLNQNPSDLGGSDQDRKEFLNFLKLVYQAQFKNDLKAMIKVKLAYLLYSEKLYPLMNQIFGRIPLSQMEDSSGKDWLHLTDFLHHKILLVQDRWFQLGGRNIENSYHTSSSQFSGKYLFEDVDFASSVNQGGQNLVQSFETIWSDVTMVWNMEKLEKMTWMGFVQNKEWLSETLEKCYKIKKGSFKRQEFATCLEDEKRNSQKYTSDKDRFDFKLIDMNEKSLKFERYLSDLKAADQQVDKFNGRDLQAGELKGRGNWGGDTYGQRALTEEELKDMEASYLENLFFLNNSGNRVREFGDLSNETYLNKTLVSSSKQIHQMWSESLKKTCDESKKHKKEKIVLFHSAYWIPPAPMLRDFAKMMDGTWDCQFVKVIIVTNGFETTDLNIINLYSRYLMKAFYEVQRLYLNNPSGKKGAHFEYYETRKINNSPLSLHSKVFVAGDDIFIGSSNGDVRSYYMDTNNGILLKNSSSLAKDYVGRVLNQINDPLLLDNVGSVWQNGQVTRESLIQFDKSLFNQLVSRFKFLSSLSEKNKEFVFAAHQKITNFIYDTTKMIMSQEFIESEKLNESYFTEKSEKLKIQNEKIQKFNQFLMWL